MSTLSSRLATRISQAVVLVLAACAASCIVGCGGEKDSEVGGRSNLEVVKVEFPDKQTLAQRSTLRIVVRNAGPKPVPSVLVTVETAARSGEAATAFGRRESGEGLADRNRPIWILDRGPEGGDTAYNNTWKVGPVGAGAKQSFSWDVTAVRPGTYTLRYTLQDRSSKPRSGSLKVHVKPSPPGARVADDGAVARDL